MLFNSIIIIHIFNELTIHIKHVCVLECISHKAEHLKYGGPILRRWIEQICNSIADLESVPDSLKTGIIIPVYKGGGKDPLDTNSYRGIT